MPTLFDVLYFQGTAVMNGGEWRRVRDGCVARAGTGHRLATKRTRRARSQYPSVGDPNVSVRGMIPANGALRYYQCWYRKRGARSARARRSILTNALQVSWTP
jgi:hypothetical protein